MLELMVFMTRIDVLHNYAADCRCSASEQPRARPKERVKIKRKGASSYDWKFLIAICGWLAAC